MYAAEGLNCEALESTGLALALPDATNPCSAVSCWDWRRLRRGGRSAAPPAAPVRCRAPGTRSGPRRFGAESYVHRCGFSERRLQLWQTGFAPSQRIFRPRLAAGEGERGERLR